MLNIDQVGWKKGLELLFERVLGRALSCCSMGLSFYICYFLESSFLVNLWILLQILVCSLFFFLLSSSFLSIDVVLNETEWELKNVFADISTLPNYPLNLKVEAKSHWVMKRTLLNCSWKIKIEFLNGWDQNYSTIYES